MPVDEVPEDPPVDADILVLMLPRLRLPRPRERDDDEAFSPLFVLHLPEMASFRSELEPGACTPPSTDDPSTSKPPGKSFVPFTSIPRLL